MFTSRVTKICNDARTLEFQTCFSEGKKNVGLINGWTLLVSKFFLQSSNRWNKHLNEFFWEDDREDGQDCSETAFSKLLNYETHMIVLEIFNLKTVMR